jgi:hypothetical protein
MNINRSVVLSGICTACNARVLLSFWEAGVRVCRIYSHSAIAPTVIAVLFAIIITVIGFYPAVKCLKKWMEEPKNMSHPAYWLAWIPILYLALEVGMME